MAKIKFDDGTIVNFNGTPTPKDVEEVALKLGIKKQVQKPQSLLSKASGAVDSVMKPVSNFLYGSSAKAVGGLITAGIGSGTSLYGMATGNKELVAKGQKLKAVGESTMTPTNVAFSALELYPGGGQLAKKLIKLPGGVQIAEALSKIPEGLKKSAISQYSKIFGATTKESKALTEKVVPKLLAQNKVITSAKKLQTQAGVKATEFGGKIDTWFKSLPAGTKEKVQPIFRALSQEQNKYKVGSKIINETAYNAFEKLKDNITTQSGEIATKNLRKFRQIWDEYYNVSKGIEDITAYTKKAQRVGADAIRAELAKTRPELDKLNKEFSFWTNVRDLAEFTAEKASNRAVGSGLGLLAGGASGYQTGGISGSITGATIGAILGKQAIDLMRSPGWNSVSAVAKNKLADALISGSKKEIDLIISKIISGGANLLRND